MGHDVGVLLTSIPAPPGSTLSIGPLELHLYGVFIAIAAFVATIITKRRFVARGGSGDVVEMAAVIGIISGIIGARLWHIATRWGTYRSNLGDVFAVWNGGLAIYGALIGGAIGVLIVLRYKKADVVAFLDSVAPALPIAQAIGRLGNYFNQELFGKPSGLPWALRVDPENRFPPYLSNATFHPAFLYEALLNLILATALFWLDRTKRVRRGMLFPIYVAGYGLIRWSVEIVRIDRTYGIVGWTVNGYIAALIFIGGVVATFIVKHYADQGDKKDEPLQTSNA